MKTFLEQARAGEKLTDWDIVDMHAHLGRISFPIFDTSAESLISEMDRIGVGVAVLSHMQCMLGHVEAGNDELLAAMRKHPGRILGYTSVWPHSAQAVGNEAQRRLEQGFTGIKLHNANGFGYDHAHYVPAWELADAHRLPVLLHTWGQGPEFAQVRALAEKYPGANLILGHSGSLKVDEYTAIGRQFPNVYLDTCFSRTPMKLVAQLVEGAGADKVVWGSDCYFFSMTQQIGKMGGAKLSEEDKRKVVSTNARRILAQRRV